MSTTAPGPGLRASVAIDTGGTFTDLSARLSDSRIVRLKVPSTPDDPGRAVLDAIAALRAEVGSLELDEVRHGSTVATNALLERRGADVVLVTTAGFEDVLRLRRQARPDLYALHPVVPPPLVPPGRCLGVSERLGPDGKVVSPIEDCDAFVRRCDSTFRAAGAVAVCLLHSYANPEHEVAIGNALKRRFPGLSVTLSSAIAPVLREFERCSTTVVNAFVAPVMSAYLQRLQAALSPTPLRVMASSGGLLPSAVAADAPVHTVLSGPAGGVAGAWQAAQSIGKAALLTVDMGGTSTDVSVVQGALAPVDDGALGPHPIRAPLLPIETVGAGGGSIAFIDDGGALRVGPRSAGAEPGPACYGHAGDDAEPTVTDAHVVLGRLPQLLGGAMPLHVELARQAVGRLAAQLNVSIEAAAEAIVALATASMARACKRVSMQRGVDPRGLSLVAFGGAGGLHGCELADELGCAEVLVPAAGGVLSAEGIGVASPQTAVTITVMQGVRELGGRGIRELVQRAMGQASAALAHDWSLQHNDAIERRCTLDMRYRGQGDTLAIRAVDAMEAGATAAFEGAHRARFGYVLHDRAIELVAARVFAIAATSRKGRESAVFVRPSLPASAHDSTVLRGPRSVPAYGSTLWLPIGWQAVGDGHGGWICRRDPGATPHRHIDRRDTALALEIHRHRLAAIAEQMGAVLRSAAFSANIKERRDYSCAIFDRLGRMLCHAAHIPVHLGSTPASVAAAIAAVPMRRGQHVVLNDPFAGGTHLPDVTVVTPVFLHPTDAAPAYYVANRAHHADVGGISPGSMPAPFDAQGRPRALTIDDEGIRLPPTVLDDAVRSRFAAASRTPDERLGDLRAQEAANDAGVAQLQALVHEHGAADLGDLDDALLDYAQRRMQAVTGALPDGAFHFEDALDDDGTSELPVPIRVTLTIDGERALVDFTASADSGPGPLNAVAAIATSAAFYVFRALAGAVGEVGGSIPANAGMMRPVQVVTRRGSVLDARYPSAVSSGNVETSQRAVDALLGALAQAAPELVPAASNGSMNNVLMGGGEPAPWVHYETLAGGAGAGPRGDGADAIHSHMTNTLNTPVEALEHAFPVRIERYAVRPTASAGADHRGGVGHRGGAGIERAYRFLAPAEVTLVTERRRNPPWSIGLAPPGALGRNRLLVASGEVRDLPGKCALSLQAGDLLEVCTPGGGHFVADAPEQEEEQQR